MMMMRTAVDKNYFFSRGGAHQRDQVVENNANCNRPFKNAKDQPISRLPNATYIQSPNVSTQFSSEVNLQYNEMRQGITYLQLRLTRDTIKNVRASNTNPSEIKWRGMGGTVHSTWVQY